MKKSSILVSMLFPIVSFSDVMFVSKLSEIKQSPNINSKSIELVKRNTPLDIEKQLRDNGKLWYKLEGGGYIQSNVVSKKYVKTHYKPKIDLKQAHYQNAKSITNFDKSLYIDKNGRVFTKIDLSTILKPKANKKLNQKLNTPSNVLGSDMVASNSVNNKDTATQSYKYFASLMLGSLKTSNESKYTNGMIIFDEAKDSATLPRIQVGVYKDKFAYSFNMEKADLDNLELVSYYLQGDYYFMNNDFNPYIGLSAGIIEGTWEYDLLGTSQTKSDKEMSAYQYGIHLGIQYKITNNFDFLVEANYKKADLETEMFTDTASAEYNIDGISAINFGIRYNFD